MMISNSISCRLATTCLLATSIWCVAPAQAAATCENGRIWIPDDGLTADISGYCEQMSIAGNDNEINTEAVRELNVMGNGNTVTLDRLDDLKVGGDNNVIQYRVKVNGLEPTKWFGGDNNKLVFIEGGPLSSVSAREQSGSQAARNGKSEAELERLREEINEGRSNMSEAELERLKEELNEGGSSMSEAELERLKEELNER